MRPAAASGPGHLRHVLASRTAAHQDSPGALEGIRVLTCADGPLLTRALSSLLREHTQADVRPLDDLRDARALVAPGRRTVLLWAVDHVELCAVGPVAELRASCGAGVAILADTIAPEALRELLARDTRGIGLLQHARAVAPEEVVRCLAEVSRGRSAIDPQTLGSVLATPQVGRLAQLSDAEREIAVLVASGWRNGVIAQRLWKSERTIEKHVANIFMKLGLCARRHPDIDRRVTVARLVAAEAGAGLALDGLEAAGAEAPAHRD